MDIQEKVPALREKFLEKHRDSLFSDVYHADDVERLRTEDIYVQMYLKHNQNDVDQAVAMIDQSFKWRKEMNINGLTEKSFPRWLHDLGALYYRNSDKKGKKILYFDVSKTRKEPDKYHIVKQFVAWWIDKHYLTEPSVGALCPVFDMSSARMANMDMEMIKFQVSIFTKYYPALLEYMLIYEMPWVLNVIWSIIKPLLSASQQKAVVFVKKSEITNYISQENLWPHMGGTDRDFTYNYMPSGDSGVELDCEDDEDDEDENAGDERDRFASLNGEAGNNVKRRRKSKSNATSDEGAAGAEVSTAASSNNSIAIKKVSFSGSVKQVSEDTPPQSISPPEPTNFTLVDDMLHVSPVNRLFFNIPTQMDDCIVLKNEQDRVFAFKIKTTSPLKFKVRPSGGIITAQSSNKVKVTLMQQNDIENMLKAKDKFLVMFTEVKNTEYKNLKSHDIFRVTSPELMHQYRIQCRVTHSLPLEDIKPADPLDVIQKKMDQLLDNQDTMQAKLDDLTYRHTVFVYSCCTVVFVWLLLYILCFL